MAVRGASLTSTQQPLPSIFEVVASDSLQSNFYPVYKRLFSIIESKIPEKIVQIRQFHDEIFLIINAFIQQYYIRHYGGSLSEAFYGLTRTKLTAENLSETLPTNTKNHHKLIVFFSIVIIPYLRIKLDQWCQRSLDNLESGQQQTITKLKFTKFSVKSYQLICALHDNLQVLQYLAYISNSSKSHTILLRILGFHLIYLQENDLNNFDWSTLTWQNIRSIRFSTLLTNFIFRGLEFTSFFLQYIQWWHNEDTHRETFTALKSPSEPPEFNIQCQKYSQLCPICLQKWNIPTAISITGYVYCYKCIVNHFNVKKTCPITNIPANIDDLINIYDE